MWRSVRRRGGNVPTRCRHMAPALWSRTYHRTEWYREWTRRSHPAASRIGADLQQRFGDAGKSGAIGEISRLGIFILYIRVIDLSC